MNLLVADINFDAQLARNKEQSDLVLRDKKEKLAASRAERNYQIRAEIEEIRENGIEETPLQSVHRQIDEVAENSEGNEVIIRKKRPIKTWTKRPDNWVDIVEEANAYSSRQAIRSFEEEFEGLTKKASMKKFKKKKKNYFNVRIPAYGSVIDNLVLLDFQRRSACGLPVNNVILRRILIVHLTVADLLNTLIENGG